jgi:putative ABC transport system permease protein
MIRHLMRLVWNRKQQNLLLSFEILLSFLVLFAVVHLTVVNVYGYGHPLGFTHDRLWTLELRYSNAGPLDRRRHQGEGLAERARAEGTLRQVYAALEDLPDIERYAATWPSTAFDGGGWSSTLGTARAVSWMNFADDGFDDVMGLRVVAGRWFSPEDESVPWQPIVINQRLARELFGEGDPLNQTIPFAFGQPPLRVVGVIDDFRQGGEFMSPSNYTFHRLRQNDAAQQTLPSVVTIRITPNTTAEFEQTLVETLQAVAPDWSFAVQTLESKRESRLRDTLNPLASLGLIAVFLLLMVALGLTGVVWQSVTARFQEYGLRRAKGATIADVRRQVLTELALLTSLALIVGLALIAQLPIAVSVLNANSFSPPPPAVSIVSVGVSVGVIYLLTLLCGWFPSRLATKIQPAEALHY